MAMRSAPGDASSNQLELVSLERSHLVVAAQAIWQQREI